MTGDDVGKEIRMVVTFRKVTEDKFWEALKAAIAPKLSQVRACAATCAAVLCCALQTASPEQASAQVSGT